MFRSNCHLQLGYFSRTPFILSPCVSCSNENLDFIDVSFPKLKGDEIKINFILLGVPTEIITPHLSFGLHGAFPNNGKVPVLSLGTGRDHTAWIFLYTRSVLFED